MGRFTVHFAPRAWRQLEKLPIPARHRVSRVIDALAEDPRPRGASLLSGPGGTWRVRIGEFRVLYEIQDVRLLVLVVRVGHRREIYRGRNVSEEMAVYASVTDRARPHGGRSWTRDALHRPGTP
ncbi:MAG: type II toxin-antitoxin system RelE/ParE family toxin [Chloroflexota bacterium]